MFVDIIDKVSGVVPARFHFGVGQGAKFETAISMEASRRKSRRKEEF